MKLIVFLLTTSLLLLKMDSLQAQDEAAMMKAWQEFMTPGEMHKLMSTWNGTWNAEVTSYMDPTAPMKSSATLENKMVLNGLYQLGHYTGTMMGMPFEGHSTLAYDNSKKMFVNTWIDNLGSGVVIMTGKWNADTKMLDLRGFQTNPVNGKDSALRQEITIIDDNTQKMIMYGEGMDGKEAKFMEMTMKRIL